MRSLIFHQHNAPAPNNTRHPDPVPPPPGPSCDDADAAPSSRAASRHVSSFPVDDIAPFASSNSLRDAAAAGDDGDGDADMFAAAPATADLAEQRRRQRGGGDAGAYEGGAMLKVPKLRLAAAAGGVRPDVASASRLTEQNISPFNVAFEATRGGGGGGGAPSGRGGDFEDTLTIATVNRYTYGLGPEVGMASAPITPRSGAASESGVGAHRKKQGLFRGLRRKGQKANQQLR